MACVIVPAVEAVIATVTAKAIKSKEAKKEQVQLNDAAAEKIPFSKKLKWLSHLLWGGSVLLLFEHIWHGEIVPWFPFLTAAGSPADTAAMLQEMATSGVAMALLVTAVWGGMLAFSSVLEKRAAKAQPSEN